MKPVILIPAYRPEAEILPELIKKIAAFDVEKIVVINDGSPAEFIPVFDGVSSLPKTEILHHKENLGKGAALKTGFNHVLKSKIKCSGVITVDADGQHLPEDVYKIIETLSQEPRSLILGVRGFSGKVPLRSFIGNKATYFIFRGLVGRKISDTQTGLRGIPFALLEELIKLQSDRYAYELEMLLNLIQKEVSIREVTITTVYEEENASSSFRPIKDSMLIYKTLIIWWLTFRFRQMIRYSMSGIFSTAADFGTYILLINLSCGFVTASVLARFLSVIIHFSANKYFTFSYKNRPQFLEIFRYLLVVLFNLISSIGLIYLFITYLPLGEVTAKVAAQMILFLATYALLNGFVFLRQQADQ